MNENSAAKGQPALEGWAASSWMTDTSRRRHLHQAPSLGTGYQFRGRSPKIPAALWTQTPHMTLSWKGLSVVTQPSYSLRIAEGTGPLGGAERLTPGQALPRTAPGCWDYCQPLPFLCAFAVQAEAAGQEAIRWSLLLGLRYSLASSGELCPGVPNVTVTYTHARPLLSHGSPCIASPREKSVSKSSCPPTSAPKALWPCREVLSRPGPPVLGGAELLGGHTRLSPTAVKQNSGTQM